MPVYRASRARLVETAKRLKLRNLAQAVQQEGFSAPWLWVDGEWVYVLEAAPLDPVPEGWEEVPEAVGGDNG